VHTSIACLEADIRALIDTLEREPETLRLD
jgi:hypothetical protein